MKIKLDENLPLALATALRAIGYDLHTVPDEELSGHNDNDVFAAAQSEGRVLITSDFDFSDIRRFAPGSHAGIVLIRLHQPDTASIVDRVMREASLGTLDGWERCLVVLSDSRTRVRTP